jgi:hypothetical protein
MKECAVDAAAGMHVQDLDPEVTWNDMQLTRLVDLKIGNHGALYPAVPETGSAFWSPMHLPIIEISASGDRTKHFS